MESLERKIKELDPMIRATVDLFKPFVEAAVYDTVQGRIVVMYNSLTKRKIGDRISLKEVSQRPFPDYFPPHYKMNHDGRVIKCTLVPLKEADGALIGFLSFSVDTSAIKGLFNVLSNFLGMENEVPPTMEENEGFEERARFLIDEFFKERNDPSRHLGRDDKKVLIQFLHKKGLFNYKKAPFELAKWLKISRASIYNYIKN